MNGTIALQKERRLSTASIAIFLTEGSIKKDQTLSKIPEIITKHEFSAKKKESFQTENIGGFEHLFAVGLGDKKELTPKRLKNKLASVVRMARAKKIKELTVRYQPGIFSDPYEAGKNIAQGFILGNYEFTTYKSEPEKKKMHFVTSLSLDSGITDKKSLTAFEKGIQDGTTIAEGIILARELINAPPIDIDPAALARKAQEIATSSKGLIKAQIFDEKQCAKMGMGSFLAVGQGSAQRPKFIVLHYKPASIKSKQKIALIGKSITFDSGGYSLKPPAAMEDMKVDMSGGAAVLGVFSTLTALKPSVEVFGILAAAENMVSGTAIRPGDIVTAMNGKTIEILNTDAEGRLTLADALVYAETACKADLIIDLATLTGACMVALGTDLAGLFSNDNDFADQYGTIAKREGDKTWRMPMYKPYLKQMKSPYADLKNIGGGKYGGAITAALFLSEFVEKAKWIHVDIAGPATHDTDPKGIYSKGGTGWGVASLIQFLKEM